MEIFGLGDDLYLPAPDYWRMVQRVWKEDLEACAEPAMTMASVIFSTSRLVPVSSSFGLSVLSG